MSDDPSSLSPGLAEAIDLRVQRILDELHTSMPGTVVSYDHTTQSATVQPALKRKYKLDDAPQALPQLQKVPVVFPAGGGAYLRLPVKAGDTVQLHFAERAINSWFAQGGLADPANARRFALMDAVATPGLNPSTNPVPMNGASDSLELGLISGGTAARLEITSAGKFKVTNQNGQELLAVLDQLISDLQSWTSINCVVGSPVTPGPSTLVNLALDQTNLRSLKS